MRDSDTITSTATRDVQGIDAEAFRRLVSASYRRMFLLAARLTGCDADGEDVVQDVLARLWQQRDILTNVKNREAYLAGMTRNAAIDFIRRKKPMTEIDSAAMSVERRSFDDQERLRSQQEQVEEVMASLACLSENQRTVVTLRDVEGMELDEIASATGFSAVNVRVLLSRGRKTIRSMIEKAHTHSRNT